MRSRAIAQRRVEELEARIAFLEMRSPRQRHLGQHHARRAECRIPKNRAPSSARAPPRAAPSREKTTQGDVFVATALKAKITEPVDVPDLDDEQFQKTTRRRKRSRATLGR